MHFFQNVLRYQESVMTHLNLQNRRIGDAMFSLIVIHFIINLKNS